MKVNNIYIRKCRWIGKIKGAKDRKVEKNWKGVGLGLGKELEPRISKKMLQKVGNGCKMVREKGTKVKRKGNMVEGWMKILVGI